MLTNLPMYVWCTFLVSTAFTFLCVYLAIKQSSQKSIQRLALKICIGVVCWLLIQAVLSVKGVYTSSTNDMPPKIVLFGVLPTLFFMIVLFVTTQGKKFITSMPIKWLTWIHVVRIPVELTLFWLYLSKYVPELMTFEGRNFDIIAGISAPFIAYVGVAKKRLNKNILLLWNFISLALLFNIILNALLSAPSPIQQFAFNQPNIAVLYFPFSWLPTFIVPVVLFAHLCSIKQLLLK